jgi:hypothetical protein
MGVLQVNTLGERGRRALEAHERWRRPNVFPDHLLVLCQLV